jgi:hypothetical protein
MESRDLVYLMRMIFAGVIAGGEGPTPSRWSVLYFPAFFRHRRSSGSQGSRVLRLRGQHSLTEEGLLFEYFCRT